MFLAEEKEKKLSSPFGRDLCPAIKHCFCNAVFPHTHEWGKIWFCWVCTPHTHYPGTGLWQALWGLLELAPAWDPEACCCLLPFCTGSLSKGLHITPTHSTRWKHQTGSAAASLLLHWGSEAAAVQVQAPGTSWLYTSRDGHPTGGHWRGRAWYGTTSVPGAIVWPLEPAHPLGHQNTTSVGKWRKCVSVRPTQVPTVANMNTWYIHVEGNESAPFFSESNSLPAFQKEVVTAVLRSVKVIW